MIAKVVTKSNLLIMLSKETRKKIKVMVQDERLGDEIILRMSLLQQTPKRKSQVVRILGQFDTELSDQIMRTLKTKMANYDHGECGNEIANGLNGVVEVLQAALKDQDLTSHKNNLDGEMDKISFEALAIAIGSIDCAKNFRVVYNNMIKSVCAIDDLTLDPEIEKTAEPELPVEVLAEAKQERVHVEKPSRPVVVKRIYFKEKQ